MIQRKGEFNDSVDECLDLKDWIALSGAGLLSLLTIVNGYAHWRNKSPRKTTAMFEPEDLKFPPDFFDPPNPRPNNWPDNPELRRAVDWFKSFMAPEEWIQRREKAARRLYLSAMGIVEDAKDGRFYNTKDSFGWYLFLADVSSSW